MLSDYLSRRGFEVCAAEGAEAMRRCLETRADAVVLDVAMPGQDGLSALRELRRTSQVPVLMLTAAAEVVDRVVGLELGADDYVPKPVDLRELEARLRALLRRGVRVPEAAAPATGRVPFGPCTLDLDGARLFGPDGAEIAVTAMEFALLRVFAENRGRVLSRDRILAVAHDRGWDRFDRSVDLRVSRLRRKVERNPAKPETIRTVRGIGYVFG